MRPTRSRLLLGTVWVATIAIAAQAVLAGQFISGLAPELLDAHMIVGSLLELVALVLVVLAAIAHDDRRTRRGGWWAALLLAVGLLVQAALGHMPGSLPTAIHVPLGVGLFGLGLGAVRGLSRRPAAALASQ